MKTICVMCGKDAVYIDEKTHEALCTGCTNINEDLYRARGAAGKYQTIN